MKLHVPDIELYNMSRYRGELMGAAMLFVILFHVDLSRGDPFYGLRRTGNVGVDIFLFLSGIGLWYSWTKKKSDDTDKDYFSWGKLWHFYGRRMKRIYPAWLIMAALYFVPRYSGDWLTLVGELLFNVNFWRYDELAFWYVPALMALYMVAPWYMTLLERHPVYRWLPLVAIIWCVMVQWVIPIHQAVGHLEIFWSRIPIFLIGINFGTYVKERRTVEGQGVWLLAAVWLLTFGTCLYLEQVRHGHFPLFVERMLYIPFTVTSVMLLNRVFRRTPQWVNRVFRTVGALSLECYLIHLHFVLGYLPKSWSYWPTFLACVAITLPLAWLLNKVSFRLGAGMGKAFRAMVPKRAS